MLVSKLSLLAQGLHWHNLPHISNLIGLYFPRPGNKILIILPDLTQAMGLFKLIFDSTVIDI